MKIEGYAKGDGKVIHALFESKPICDQTRSQMVKEKLTAKDVTCKKCQRLVIFKQALEEEIKKDNFIKQGLEDEKKIEKTEDEKIKEGEKINKKEDKTEQAPKPKKRRKTKLPPPKAPAKELTRYHDPQKNVYMIKNKDGLFVEEQFKSMARYDGKCKIIHLAADRVIFDNLPPKIAEECLHLLNTSVTEIWDGISPIQGGFITKVRQCLQETFKHNGDCFSILNIKKEDKDIKEERKPSDKPKKVIRRREKRELKKKEQIRVIRRRKTILAGSREGTPAFTVTDALITGTIKPKTKGDIIRKLKEEFKLSKEKASIAFTHSIRKAVRKKGLKVVVIMQGENPNGFQDEYRFTEDTIKKIIKEKK